MPDLNKHVITPQSTEYLTSRIESNNFVDNAATLLLAGAFDAVGDDPLISRTGNVVCYLSGTLVALGAIAQGDLIATIPTAFANKIPVSGINMVVSAIQGGVTLSDVVGVFMNTGGTAIEIRYQGSAGMIATDNLSLHGIIFNTSNK